MTLHQVSLRHMQTEPQVLTDPSIKCFTSRPSRELTRVSAVAMLELYAPM